MDIIRPNDPISFIANFMLKNKSTVKNIKQILEQTIKTQEPSVHEENEDDHKLDEEIGVDAIEGEAELQENNELKGSQENSKDLALANQ